MAIPRPSHASLAYRDCVASIKAAKCVHSHPELIAAANGVVVSPDGSSVYAVSYQGGTVATFSRAADGALTYAGCFADHGRHGCMEPEHSSLAHAYNVAVSPDGTSVYGHAG